MKKVQYEAVEIELIRFDAEDVITTSLTGNGNPNGGWQEETGEE